jgi:hypothetical protein
LISQKIKGKENQEPSIGISLPFGFRVLSLFL